MKKHLSNINTKKNTWTNRNHTSFLGRKPIPYSRLLRFVLIPSIESILVNSSHTCDTKIYLPVVWNVLWMSFRSSWFQSALLDFHYLLDLLPRASINVTSFCLYGNAFILLSFPCKWAFTFILLLSRFSPLVVVF